MIRYTRHTDESTVNPADLQTRLSKSTLPEDAATALSTRLTNLAAASADTAPIERGMALPWIPADLEPPAIATVQESLQDRHFVPAKGIATTVQHVVAHHARTNTLNRSSTPLRLLCLAGPDGVGKTAVGNSLAHALGRPCEVVDLAQLDSMEDLWHQEGQPGAFMAAIERANSANAVVVISGLDRAIARRTTGSRSLIARLTDPRRRASVCDSFFGVPFDTSRVLVMVTCRLTHHLEAEDRAVLDVAELPGFLPAEKVEIAQNALVPTALSDHGLTSEPIEFDDEALHVLIGNYTNEAGTAELDDIIRRVIRAVLVARNLGVTTPPAAIRAEHLSHFAGRALAYRRREQHPQRRGVTAALVVDAHGGRHGIVSAVLMPTLGGSLFIEGRAHITFVDTDGADVTQRLSSVVAAVRSRLSDLDVPARVMQEFSIRGHLPATTLVGDEASTGLAAAIAIVSLARDRPIDPELAATGSVAIDGGVNPTLGISHKMMAAHRAGARRVLLPRGNEHDLDELPAQIHDDMTFIPVDDIAQAVQVALR